MLLSIHGHTIDRHRKEETAPSARPRDRKKAMMAPAVSASAGFTFLKAGGQGFLRMAPGTPQLPGLACPPEHL